MNKGQLSEILYAKHVLCSYCQHDGCEWCQVMRIVNNAGTECENDTESYMHCSTNGDYGPSNPWDAPGMSVRDFI